METWGAKSHDKVRHANALLQIQRCLTARSLIDGDMQYFIAESTKTVDLVNNTKHEPGDEIWMGCSSVTKAGRLCER